MTDRLDLPTRYREQVEALLREHVPEAEVWAYGSRVNGMSHDASDLDLVLRGPDLTPIPTLQLVNLAESFQLSNIPILVETRDWAKLPESFHQEIERNHTVIQKEPVVQFEWPKRRLGDCILIDTSTISARNDRPFINYLDTGSITENRIDTIQHLVIGRDKVPTRARRKVREGDIVYSTVRPNQRHYGLLKNLPKNTVVSTGFAVIRGKKDVSDTGYIYHFLSQDPIVEYLQIIAEDNTSAYPSIKPKDIEFIELPLPPLEEQKRIAQVLVTFDDKIELNRRMCETLEEMARALFKSWFVDFDPVRAKMEGRWRPGKSLPGLPAELYDLFPNRLVNSELGPIPEGWRIVSLGDIVGFNYGKALRKRDRRAGGVPVYGSNGQIDWHDDELVGGPGIVVGRKGNPGTVYWSSTRFYPIDTTFYVKRKRCDHGWPFLFYTLARQNLPSIAADSAVPGLNRNLAYMNQMLSPPRQVRSQFDFQVSLIKRRCHLLNRQSEVLATQRDTLLPRLLSGELRC
ncbi:MAG: restriction endonuclease subunit S [bacterium]|nr:restriction endonuclease subunit S [bacterium]